MINKRVADLHVHTHLSDGTFSPEEVLRCAERCGLNAIAISDHDTVGAIDECNRLSREYDIEVIPAVEIGSEKDGNEIHILGFFIDWRSEWLKGELGRIRSARLKRAKKILEKLEERDIELDMDELLASSGPGSLGRLHIAQLMLKKGYISSIGEAFQGYIGNNDPCFVKYVELNPAEAISMIIKVGGIPVIAHPYIVNHDEYIPQFVKDGLMGIEVYHSDHPDSVNRRYLDIAQEYNLLVTGGSDCHGMGKGGVLMGKVKVPYSLVGKLKEAKARLSR